MKVPMAKKAPEVIPVFSATFRMDVRRSSPCVRRTQIILAVRPSTYFNTGSLLLDGLAMVVFIVFLKLVDWLGLVGGVDEASNMFITSCLSNTWGARGCPS